VVICDLAHRFPPDGQAGISTDIKIILKNLPIGKEAYPPGKGYS